MTVKSAAKSTVTHLISRSSTAYPPQMAVMDVEFNPSSASSDIGSSSNQSDAVIIEDIANELAGNNEIYFKNQQRGESDLNKEEKANVALDILEKSKVNFLVRFGKYLKSEHLDYFKRYEDDSAIGYEISLLLKDLKANSDRKQYLSIRNRRYEALKELINGKSYFSEVEMMKRNPLLYDQLVGQYLSEAERRQRDKFDVDNITLVKILMEGIEREQSENTRLLQKSAEDDAMEETEDEESEDDLKMTSQFEDAQPSTSSAWGEIPTTSIELPKRIPPRPTTYITATERDLLKEEFLTTMYQSFLDGKDEEFDYSSVDNNDKYDNIDVISKDEEEKYFDSEDPEEVSMEDANKAESSEDELDIYMNALNQHPTVVQLSKEIEKL